MSNNYIQTSFAGGELSSSLYARVDLAKYHIGAALMSNFFVDYRGGASNRPGTKYVSRALDSNEPVRLIPFQFSTVRNYVLIFGNRTMRVVSDGAEVLNAAKSITAVTAANPGVVTVPTHGYSAGDQVYFTNMVGTTQLNQKTYFVYLPTTNTFQLRDWNGNVLNTSGYGAFVSGQVASVFTVTSPYAASDLALVKFTQSADVMTLVHPNYVPYDLETTGPTSWTFVPVSIGSSIAAPTGLMGVIEPATAGTAAYAYMVTAVAANGDESVASGVDNVFNAVDISAVAGSITLSWIGVPGAVSYNLYKANPASNITGSIPPGVALGFMGTSTTTTFVDTNIVPDFTFTPPIHTDPFAGGNNPGAVTYHQQRKVYAGSNAQPETFWMSQPGAFKNFDVANPVIPSDAITGTLVSRQVNNIKYMISMPGGLIMLTGGGAWQVNGGSGDAPITPTSISATPQAYNGCADVEPITINYDILYVQQKGTVVRDLSYSFYTNIYTGADLSVLSNHLFTGYSIKEWAYAEEPFKIVWCVRSDGALLSLTYLKEQEVFGWAQHSTQGRFTSITSIQEGQENVIYVAVQRLIQGRYTTYIERMASRFMPYGAEDAWFLDSALTNDLTYPSATLFVSSAEGDNVTLGTTPPIFSPGDVGKVVRAGKGIIKITGYQDSTYVTGDVSRAIEDLDIQVDPPVVWGQAPGTWSMTAPVSTVSGLDHLEGQTVSILGDGNVFPQQVVVNGAITLSQPCSKIIIGLGFTARLQTLYLDIGDPTIQGKRKFIPRMTARVDQTRGISMGPTFDALTEFKDRDLDTIGNPIELFSGDQYMVIESLFATEGQMCIEQANPLPATILGVIPEISLGDTAK